MTNIQGFNSVFIIKNAAFPRICKPLVPPGMNDARYHKTQQTWKAAANIITIYLFIKTVRYIVIIDAKMTDIIGAALTKPEFNRFLKNTDGFCITMTLEAARIVASVIHKTNFEGRNISVGNPTNIANKKNMAAAIRR